MVTLIFGLVAIWGMVFLINGCGVSKEATDMSAIMTSLVAYHNRAGHYPTSEQGLEALVEKPIVEPIPKRWIAGLKPTALNDRWGNAYQYVRWEGLPGGVGLFTFGPDGMSQSMGNDPDDYATWTDGRVAWQKEYYSPLAPLIASAVIALNLGVGIGILVGWRFV
ncbi:MAG: type II secretion system protein GspG [Verrucomicrobiota bacterium]